VVGVDVSEVVKEVVTLVDGVGVPEDVAVEVCELVAEVVGVLVLVVVLVVVMVVVGVEVTVELGVEVPVVVGVVVVVVVADVVPVVVGVVVGVVFSHSANSPPSRYSTTTLSSRVSVASHSYVLLTMMNPPKRQLRYESLCRVKLPSRFSFKSAVVEAHRSAGPSTEM